jgi:hypothetical protein
MLILLLMNCFTDLNKFDCKEFTVGTQLVICSLSLSGFLSSNINFVAIRLPGPQ